MKVLFLITARSGSKGIPAKNLQPVGGIPLVGRACRVRAQAAGRLGNSCRVVCSTDDAEIARVAQAWGAETPWLRPAELASDSAASIDVVIHALDALGEDFDLLVLLQPTSPLVEAEDVLGAVRLSEERDCPVVSVCPNEHPPTWSYFLDDRQRLLPVMPGDAPWQRQGAAVSYRLNGAVYVASPSVLGHREVFSSRGPWDSSCRRSVPSILTHRATCVLRRPCWPSRHRRRWNWPAARSAPASPASSSPKQASTITATWSWPTG